MSQAGISASSMGPVRLTLGPGWTQARARKLPFGLALLAGGRLEYREATWARVGPEPGPARREARLPICASARTGVVYWVREDPAELIASDPAGGARRIAGAEGLAYLLAYDPVENEVVSFRPGKPGRLVFIGADGRSREARVEGGGLYPGDVSFASRRALFGRDSEEMTLHDLAGKVVARAVAPASPEYLTFHPSGGSAAIAHGGLSVWDFASGKLRRVAERGRRAEWSPDGRELWFSDVDSELWTLDLESGETARVLKLEGDSAGCTNFTNRPRWSPDGRFLLAQLSRKAAVSASEEARRRREEPNGWETGYGFDFDHYFCVLEPRARRVWLKPGYAHQVVWTKLR